MQSRPTTTSGKIGQSSFKTKHAESEPYPSVDSNSLWVIERARAIVGGPCLWHDSFRLQHLNTGKYLSIDDEGRASGRARVLCQSEERAFGTLFSFHKLKNKTAAKVDGMQDVIFPNQPFLICKDPTMKMRAHGKARRETSADGGNGANNVDPPDRPGPWWLSSADEAVPDANTEIPEMGAADSFRRVVFAVHATQQKRIQVRKTVKSTCVVPVWLFELTGPIYIFEHLLRNTKRGGLFCM